MPTTIFGHHTGLWGVYLSVAELPNTSGATEQSTFLRKVHMGITLVSGVPGLYICTTATLAGGVWAQLMHTGSSVTGDLTLSGTLSAEQITSSDDATIIDDLAVTGLMTVGETLNVVGDFSINTNKLTVAGSSGNTVVAGTLTSSGTLIASGAATVGTTLGVTGAATLTGGTVQGTAFSGVHNLQITVATGGTDVTPADGTQFVTSIFVPVNITLTGKCLPTSRRNSRYARRSSSAPKTSGRLLPR